MKNYDPFIFVKKLKGCEGMAKTKLLCLENLSLVPLVLGTATRPHCSHSLISGYSYFLRMIPEVTSEVNGPFPINQNFELNKSRQKFHHSLKEHHKISNIPKFRCKIL